MIIPRAKTLSKTPPKVAGPPPATTFFSLSPSSNKTDRNRLTYGEKKAVLDSQMVNYA
jgi:hypothetical protein